MWTPERAMSETKKVQYRGKDKGPAKKPTACSNRSATKRKLVAGVELKAKVKLEGDEKKDYEHCVACVEKLYRNGNSHRGGGKEQEAVLIAKYQRTRHIASCLVFGTLGPKYREIIDNKAKSKDREGPEFLRYISTVLLKAETNPEYYVRLSTNGRAALEQIAKTGSTDGIDKSVFNVRTIFEDQERKKVLGV